MSLFGVFADDGPGIPDEEHELVFETGYSAAADGTGLGLAIVEDIAEAQGWSSESRRSTDGARFDGTGVENVAAE